MKQSVGAISGHVRARVRRRLLAWYDRHQRDLPWRRRADDPYAQMLAELMLQQTQVATVVGYFERFIARFPTIASLAHADINEVLTLWSGLGYYSRARHLHSAARAIADRHGGVVPSDVPTLMTLPGIGRYTAGAIASIAYDRRAAVVDGNVARVLLRLLAWADDPKSPAVRNGLWAVAEQLLPRTRCGAFNQALMELGATLCRPKSPVCKDCPIREDCRACALGLTNSIPRPAQRAKIQSVEQVVAAIRYRDRLLFVQRPLTGLWAGLWELPSEPLGPGESPAQGLKRLRARLGCSCRIKGTSIGSARRQLTHRTITFHLFEGRLCTSKPRPAGKAASSNAAGLLPARECSALPGGGQEPVDTAEQAFEWLSPQDLAHRGISRASLAVLQLLPRRS